MINIQKNYSLKDFNAFGNEVVAKYFVEINTEEELLELIKNKELIAEKRYVIGKTYNTLFVSEFFDGLIIKVCIKGKEKLEETDNYVVLKVNAGEDWPELVEYAVSNNWQGIENLALIPGSVGAAPVQNIAAYGQVLEDVFVSLEAINLENGEKKEFRKEECEFAYRTSIFKKGLIGKFIVTSVTLKLNKVTGNYIPNTSYHSRYESLQGELDAQGKSAPYALKDIFEAVVGIRNKKLPKVEEWGTLGSVFMNPFISKKQLEKIQEKYPNIQFYPVDKMQYPDKNDPILQESEIVKIPAGWILEELGWKGKWVGNVGTFDKHALIVVTKKTASGKEILDYIREMQQSVIEATGIGIKPEVNIVG
jgi:UDP-N-acetylmuramate dehydrogenase